LNERSLINMQTRFEEKREKSMALISAAALKVFSEVGYDKASIRLISKEANVALGLLYNYFPSKEALLKNILSSCFGEILLLAMSEEEKEKLALPDFIRQLVKKIKLDQSIWKLYFNLKFQNSVTKELEEITQKPVQYTLQLLEYCLMKTAVPFPGLEAKFIWASLNGLIIQYILEDNYPLDDMAYLLISKYERR